MKHEGNSDTNFNWWPWNNPQRAGKNRRGIVNQRKNRDHPDNRYVQISSNTQESPRDQRRNNISQTTATINHLKLV